jgi:hypothetical protein
LPDSSVHIFDGRNSNDRFRSANEESLVISVAWSKFLYPLSKNRMLIMYQFKAEFTAKHGKITELSVDYNGVEDENLLKSSLLNREIHKVTDWEEVFPSFLDGSHRVDVADERRKVLTPGRGMNELFGAGNYKPSEYVKE